MATYLLVHGAWHGGWCWDRVRPLLESDGSKVYTPTLTGLSERSHLISPQVGLDTHVEDIVNLIDKLELDQVILVGHSYAGQIITQVAELRPDKIARRVYLDAFVGEDGEAAKDLLPETVAHHWEESAQTIGFGWLVAVRKLSVLGVEEQADIDWLLPKLTPHPWKTYTDALRLTDSVAAVPAAFIECVSWMRVFEAQGNRAKAKGWPYFALQTGHEAMVTAPIELAQALQEIALIKK